MAWYVILIHSVFALLELGALLFYIFAACVSANVPKDMKYPWYAHMIFWLTWLSLVGIHLVMFLSDLKVL